MVFPVVMYGCESWTVKKAEYPKGEQQAEISCGVRSRAGLGVPGGDLRGTRGLFWGTGEVLELDLQVMMWWWLFDR